MQFEFDRISIYFVYILLQLIINYFYFNLGKVAVAPATYLSSDTRFCRYSATSTSYILIKVWSSCLID